MATEDEMEAIFSVGRVKYEARAEMTVANAVGVKSPVNLRVTRLRDGKAINPNSNLAVRAAAFDALRNAC